MNKLTMLIAGLMVAGCTSLYQDEGGTYTSLPPELKDCKIFALYPNNGSNRIIVVRCPHADTHMAIPKGKSRDFVSVIQ